ncbi:glycosyltransferase family 9 protein (plasmid) [Fusobacterium sp. SB021]|uniref:glycosyltransferase family 9 protein n=1 Tax=Fusobacterium sp. SB021 TaxID=2744227 RepID=UPI003CFAD43A
MIKKINRDVPKSNQIIISLVALFIKKRKNNKFLLKDGMKILIVYPRRIGDCVMLIPFLKNLKDSFPDINITILGPKYFKDFMNNQNLYDQFIDFGKSAGPVSGREWFDNFNEIETAYKKIKNNKYDVAIEPFGSAFGTIFMHRFKADNYIGVNIGNLKKILDYAATYDDDAHIIDNSLSLLKEIGGKIKDENKNPIIIPTISWALNEKKYREHYNLNNKFIIGIHCGASAIIKQWQGYGELIKHLIKTYDKVFIILFGTKEDTKQLEKILKESDLHTGQYMIFQSGLRDYIDTLNLCDYVICNDSSCGHLASAQGIDVAVIYGPYLPVMGTPRGKANTVLISKNLQCKPCGQFSCKYGDDIKCLKAISPFEVFSLIKKEIDKKYK